MVMSPAPGTRAPRLRRFRFSLRCWLGRHLEYTQEANVVGSQWRVSLHYCKRCWRVLDDCYAKNTETR